MTLNSNTFNQIQINWFESFIFKFKYNIEFNYKYLNSIKRVGSGLNIHGSKYLAPIAHGKGKEENKKNNNRQKKERKSGMFSTDMKSNRILLRYCVRLLCTLNIKVDHQDYLRVDDAMVRTKNKLNCIAFGMCG